MPAGDARFSLSRRLERRLRALLRRGTMERDLDDEVRFHVERETEANVARGMSAAEARREALIAFGGMTRTKLECRDARGVRVLEELGQDLRFGLRMLVKSPVFTLTAIVTLALGIGANSAMFGAIDAVLIRPLPYRDADRLVVVWETTPRSPHNVINLANFFDWRKRNDVFADMAAFTDDRTSIVGDGEPEEVAAQRATDNLFAVLGVHAVLGRTFTPDDSRPGQNVVVLGHRLWLRRFGGDPDVIGRQILLGGISHQVIGVLPADFRWHIEHQSRTGRPAELWVPLPLTEEFLRRRGRFAASVARLKPGVSHAQARAQMQGIGRQLAAEYPDFNSNHGVDTVPLRDELTGPIGQPLLLLMAAVGFVLLIACANMANLLLARSPARRRELTVRAALGASRGRIIRQLLTESILLAMLGGAAGVLVAWAGTQALAALGPPELTSLQGVGVNAAVLAFTTAIALLTGLVFGLAPAAFASSVQLSESLREASRAVVGHARGRRLRGALVVVEVAFALVLLVGAGLFIRSLLRLQAVSTGLNPQNVLTMRITLPTGAYDQDASIVGFFTRVSQRTREVPGVEAAGSSNWQPFAGPPSVTRFAIEGRPAPPPGQEPITGVCVGDAGFFRTLQIPVERGRLFTEDEVRERRDVVIVNQALVRRYFPDVDPLGQRITIRMGDEASYRPSQIIGVVGDVLHGRPGVEPGPVAYWPVARLPSRTMTLVVRTQGEPTAMASSVREVVRALDPQLPVADVFSLETLRDRAIGRQRFSTFLLIVFAGMALLLAAVGIYGVINYSVAQNTHDIGVRVALGASRAHIMRLVLARGIALTLAGIGAGLVVSLLLTPLAGSQLYGVSATDPATFGSIALLLTAVALLACYLPARRAVRIEPAVALRQE